MAIDNSEVKRVSVSEFNAQRAEVRTWRKWSENFEPIPMCKWLLEFKDIPGLDVANSTYGFINSYTLSKQEHLDNLTQMVQKVSFDNLSISTQDVYVGGGYSVSIPAGHDVKNLTVTFLENSKPNVPKASYYIRLWQNMVMDKDTGVYKVTSDYKRDARLTLFAQGGGENEYFKFIGLFPLGIGNVSFDYINSSQFVINVTFSCDDVIYNYAKETQTGLEEYDYSGKDFKPNEW